MKKIIIIEDDSDIREMYALLFRQSNYEVDEAADGLSQRLLNKNIYDAILLDLMFPGQEGLNIIKDVRSKDSINKNTPIIVLTQLDRGEKTEKALELGADLYLLKADHTPKDIFRLVNNFLLEREQG